MLQSLQLELFERVLHFLYPPNLDFWPLPDALGRMKLRRALLLVSSYIRYQWLDWRLGAGPSIRS